MIRTRYSPESSNEPSYIALDLLIHFILESWSHCLPADVRYKCPEGLAAFSVHCNHFIPVLYCSMYHSHCARRSSVHLSDCLRWGGGSGLTAAAEILLVWNNREQAPGPRLERFVAAHNNVTESATIRIFSPETNSLNNR